MPLSYSQLSLYRTCPKQYDFACIKKIPRGISAGESFGSSVHNTLAKWGRLEEQRAKSKKQNDQPQLFSEQESPNYESLVAHQLLELWHQNFIVHGYQSKVDADAARMRGEKIMQHFFDWWRKEKREILAIEKGFVLKEAKEKKEEKEAKEFSVTGRFDRVEKAGEGLRVIDYKTSAPRTQESVDEDLQLSIYALAAEQEFSLPCTELILLFLREDGVTEMKTVRSEQQKAAALSGILEMSAQIEQKEFSAIPSENVCSRCPYRSICEDSAV